MRNRLLFASLAWMAAFTPLSAQTPATRARSEQVKIEVRFISVAEDFFERIGVDFNCDASEVPPNVILEKPGKLPLAEKADAANPTFLDEKQTQKFFEKLEGDIRTNVAQMPSVIVRNGKNAVIRSTQKQLSPTKENLSTGYEVSLRPTVSADRRFIDLALNLSLSSLEGEAKNCVVEHSLEEELTIPAGHSAVVGGWKRVSEGRVEYGPPVLSKVPYVNRLFRNVGYSRSNEHVFVLVTASVIAANEEPQACAKPAACPKVVQCAATEPVNQNVATLLKCYRHACAVGNVKQAKECARQALELDPTCFDKR